MRIAKVKFMALPMEEFDVVPAPSNYMTGQAPAGTQFRSGNRTNRVAGLFTTLRAYLIRVIGRLEAARP
jgi:hypothetical protein